MGQMPKELLEYFERKQAKKAMYGAKLAAQGMRVLKEGGQFYNESGKNGSDDPPTIDDLANIRLLQGEPGVAASNLFFLKGGDGQYSSIGDMRALRQQLGEDRYGEYLAGLGMDVKRDAQGNITGFQQLDPLAPDPYRVASREFRDEAFSDRKMREALGLDIIESSGNSEAIQRSIEKSRSDVPEYQAAAVYGDMMPTTKRVKETEYLLKKLLGGQGGGQGGL